MVDYTQYLIKAYKDVKSRIASWADKAKEHEMLFGETITPHAMEQRSIRARKGVKVSVRNGVSGQAATQGTARPTDEYESRDYASGTIEARKIVECKKEMFEDSDALLDYLGFDPAVWEFIYLRHSIWEAQKKGGDVRQMYSVNYKVRPRDEVSLSLKDALAEAQTVFSSGIRPFEPECYTTVTETDGNRLLLIPQIEAHLGKLSHEIETGVNYDCKIVRDRVAKVFRESVKIQNHAKCSRCLIVVGGDFFNSESNNQTTQGTPQTSTDTRFKKMFAVGLELYTAGLKTLRDHFDDIDVLICAGNHARAMEYFLYMALKCYFHDDPKLHFSENIRDTQSYVFGKCGLFFNHGDPNEKRLLGSIPAEFYKEYGMTVYRYLFVGHLHKLEVVNSENGLVMHRVPAICENDAWHYQNRFGIGNVPQHEIMVFDRNMGMLSSHYIYFPKTKNTTVDNADNKTRNEVRGCQADADTPRKGGRRRLR